MTFLWHGEHRQIHVSGTCERVSAHDSDTYFAKRPRGSQLGAWASAQSSVLANRAELEQSLDDVASRFEGRDVDRPRFWGGYRVVPRWVEFWQGQPSRLHDRVRYLVAEDGWMRERLSP